MKILPFALIIIGSLHATGQIEKFKTDSSTVKLLRTSDYKIWEETLNGADSVWESLWFSRDTSQVFTQGWSKRSNERIGLWREYDTTGQLLIVTDYDAGGCWVNPDYYPDHSIMDRMKEIADSHIVASYSKEFFDEHVLFTGSAVAGYGDYNYYKKTGYIFPEFVGNWTTPLRSKPNHFRFFYTVKYGKGQFLRSCIVMELDSVGNFLPSYSKSKFDEYGFEDISDYNANNFNIDQINIKANAAKEGIILSDSTIISCYLTWQGADTVMYFGGRFIYHIAINTGELYRIEENLHFQAGATYLTFTVFNFNPWTGELLDITKKKSLKKFDVIKRYGGPALSPLGDE